MGLVLSKKNEPPLSYLILPEQFCIDTKAYLYPSSFFNSGIGTCGPANKMASILSNREPSDSPLKVPRFLQLTTIMRNVNIKTRTDFSTSKNA